LAIRLGGKSDMAADLISSYGASMPSCPDCASAMAMSCRENYPAEPVTFTFQCRHCGRVVQRTGPIASLQEDETR
jgi:hypothetical protein